MHVRRNAMRNSSASWAGVLKFKIKSPIELIGSGNGGCVWLNSRRMSLDRCARAAYMDRMSYNQFTIEDVKQKLGLSIREEVRIFADVERVPVSNMLRAYLDEAAPLALAFSTEKARSEMMIAPILVEVRKQRNGEIGLFSGADFNVDAERGLTGYCDFLLSMSREQLTIEAPVVAVVEAKNENLRLGTPQCLAEMVAAQIFNEQRGSTLPVVYGAVTTGNIWRFLRLRGNIADVDLAEYHIHDVEKIVGVLVQMVRGQA